MRAKEVLEFMFQRVLCYSVIGLGIWSKYQGNGSDANYFLAMGWILLITLEAVNLYAAVSEDKNIRRKKSKKKAPQAGAKRGAKLN